MVPAARRTWRISELIIFADCVANASGGVNSTNAQASPDNLIRWNIAGSDFYIDYTHRIKPQ
jgi:hypothetical protein